MLLELLCHCVAAPQLAGSDYRVEIFYLEYLVGFAYNADTVLLIKAVAFKAGSDLR